LIGHIIPLNQTPIVKTLRWPDEHACQSFAQTLAKQPLLRHALLCLHGNLGSGKTTFTRYLLQALGVTGRIKSPTYAVVESYEVAGANDVLMVWHFDFYRFKDPNEWEDAGFRDIFAGSGLKICEWPDKAAGFLPQADLDISITINPDLSREVRISAHSPTGQALLLENCVDDG
jgi:tRNA threonylcarbamoyladenosine biosynthesis protein TsaE